jgi:hypothetical protein
MPHRYALLCVLLTSASSAGTRAANKISAKIAIIERLLVGTARMHPVDGQQQHRDSGQLRAHRER